ncbi:helix-turn-helix transcriptional regulator [Achromobacter sp. Marseille-Q0513]|uniref:response regulator transcription factor n=1 Tax=Achromobacter sp. Marseille-Q0513 TaxID=2829161 RepID=UPI001BA0183B|nr:helix-turn-helix transcriptional regulator [Achromobacter sp. Marseille-Q0513]MBR8654613.1 helix-turn-helix transcriptional regulator [Achromobacter sp. Marseille-Q0513]
MQLRSDLDSLLASLTPREREIVLYVATGRANKVIAIDLGISLRTAEAHRAHIFEKLGVRNAMQLACRLCEHWRAGASPLLRYPDAAAVCAGASDSSAATAVSDSSSPCSHPISPAVPRGRGRS